MTLVWAVPAHANGPGLPRSEIPAVPVSSPAIPGSASVLPAPVADSAVQAATPSTSASAPAPDSQSIPPPPVTGGLSSMPAPRTRSEGRSRDSLAQGGGAESSSTRSSPSGELRATAANVHGIIASAAAAAAPVAGPAAVVPNHKPREPGERTPAAAPVNAPDAVALAGRAVGDATGLVAGGAAELRATTPMAAQAVGVILGGVTAAAAAATGAATDQVSAAARAASDQAHDIVKRDAGPPVFNTRPSPAFGPITAPRPDTPGSVQTTFVQDEPAALPSRPSVGLSSRGAPASAAVAGQRPDAGTPLPNAARVAVTNPPPRVPATSTRTATVAVMQQGREGLPAAVAHGPSPEAGAVASSRLAPPPPSARMAPPDPAGTFEAPAPIPDPGAAVDVSSAVVLQAAQPRITLGIHAAAILSRIGGSALAHGSVAQPLTTADALPAVSLPAVPDRAGQIGAAPGAAAHPVMTADREAGPGERGSPDSSATSSSGGVFACLSVMLLACVALSVRRVLRGTLSIPSSMRYAPVPLPA